MKKLLLAFWHYWKSLSVWFCTAFVVLLVIAAIITYFKPSIQTDSPIAKCIDRGGTWDMEENICKSSA